ncbi:unnamed protein product [Rotaria magnacalcarata]|uniref:DDE-1 domain-containing protein n=1 Tax=Rotaria magnacalcarata TaxID=392030 RepID=A0A816TNK0_9BILA|nr:unnamed protein product [Rotaria magnacalcarata]
MQRVLDFARPGIAFTTVPHAFRRVTHPMQLKRFREYVANNRNRRQKLERVEHFVLDRFRSARNYNLPAHDLDTVDDFVAEATKHIPKYKLDCVLNSDQSSFNYEIVSNCTLSYAGEKATYLSVKCLNAISHSYTVMPIISAAGQLFSSVFICLQEPTGRLPITRAVFSASNMVTSCSTSGKLNKSLAEYWIKEVLDKVVSNRFLLVVDQWSPQADITVYENNLTKRQPCKLLVIPRRATSTKQPCDAYFFPTIESVNKKNISSCISDELDVDLRSRDAILKLQSLVHNQLSSSLFKPMISYAWSTCGYIPKQYSNFSSVIDVCFSLDANSCSNNNCEQSAFICCSY